MSDIPFYCINLDSRRDRWNKIQNEFFKAKIPVIRFSGIECQKYPYFGCTLSHKWVLSLAQKSNMDIVGVFEDDIFFHNPETFMSDLEKILTELPKDWRILYLWWLIGRNAQLKKKSSFSYQINHMMCAYGMLYNSRSYKEIIPVLPNKQPEQITNISETYIDWQKEYDTWLADIYQNVYPCFVSRNFLVSERKDYSSIERRKKNTTIKYLFRFWMYKNKFRWLMILLGYLGDVFWFSDRSKKSKIEDKNSSLELM